MERTEAAPTGKMPRAPLQIQLQNKPEESKKLHFSSTATSDVVCAATEHKHVKLCAPWLMVRQAHTGNVPGNGT